MRLVEACPHDNVSGESSSSGVTSRSRCVDQHIHTATPNAMAASKTPRPESVISIPATTGAQDMTTSPRLCTYASRIAACSWPGPHSNHATPPLPTAAASPVTTGTSPPSGNGCCRRRMACQPKRPLTVQRPRVLKPFVARKNVGDWGLGTKKASHNKDER